MDVAPSGMTPVSTTSEIESFKCRRIPLIEAKIRMAATTNQDDTRRVVRLGRLLIWIPPHLPDWLQEHISQVLSNPRVSPGFPPGAGILPRRACP